MVLASYLVKLKKQEIALPEYFAGLLNTGYYKRLFQQRCKKAVGQSNISPTLLREFPVLIPPESVQRRFVRIVHESNRLRTQQLEAERQAEHLFQTLLHQAFRGSCGPDSIRTTSGHVDGLEDAGMSGELCVSVLTSTQETLRAFERLEEWSQELYLAYAWAPQAHSSVR